ncbi:MAG TPA: hypothetical protein VM429_10035, partial [Micropruina sp.]|nr:hypothetical protein [Micropruina sp.]
MPSKVYSRLRPVDRAELEISRPGAPSRSATVTVRLSGPPANRRPPSTAYSTSTVRPAPDEMVLAVTGSASGPTLPPGPFDALSAVYHAGQLDADALVGDSLTVVSGGPVVPEVSVGSGDVGTGVGVLSVLLVSMVV